MIKTMIPLHNHSHKGSLLDSILRVEELVKFAVDNKLPAVALTDHGDMSAYVDLYKHCVKNKIKPIIGCEIYEVDDYNENISKRSHLVLLAKNKIGFKNLIKIADKSARNFHRKPIITIDDIRDNNLGEGIICQTACLGGKLPKGLDSGIDMLPYYEKLEDTFDNVFVELQSHGSLDQQRVNPLLVKFAKDNNKQLVITSDAHMLLNEDVFAHKVFVAIGSARETGEFYEDCFLQTAEDTMRIMDGKIDLETLNIAIDNTWNISEMVEEFDIGMNDGFQLPIVKIPDGYKSNKDYFLHLIKEGLDENVEKYSLDKDVYLDRIKQELPVLEKLQYIDYFLAVKVAIDEMRSRNIPLGYGRGSVGGCLVAYCCGISKVDSIKWDLDFSRFANLGRRDMADIDIDISQKRRPEVIQITKDIFGDTHVIPMATFGTFTTKTAIKDIGKVLNQMENSPYKGMINNALRKEVSDMIPTIKTFDDISGGGEKEVALREVLSFNSKLSKVHENFPIWFNLVLKLEGLIKSRGVHASGVLITPKPTIEYAPCVMGKDGLVFSLEMHNAMDDLKLIKMDYLGLRNLDIVDETIKSVSKTWDDFDINNIDLNDKKVFEEIFEKANTEGVFQCESLEARKMLSMLEVQTTDDIIGLIAFNRPGTKENYPVYLRNQKLSLDKKEILHKDLIPIFSKTQGVLLYQEQALQIFRFFGFEEDEVDGCRRCIGKKDEVTMKELKDKFKQKAKDKDWKDTDIDKLWTLMENQAKYSFNKAHSVAYGLLSYLTGYLKYHYKVEFQTALLNSVVGDYSQITRYISDSQQNGIIVKPPHINKSKREFSFDKDKNIIHIGFESIKGIGGEFADKMIELRPFYGIGDLKNRLSPKVSQYIPLIKSGAIGINKEELIKNFIEEKISSKTFSPLKSTPPLKKLREEYGIDEKDKEVRLSMYNSIKKIEFEKKENIRIFKETEEYNRKYWTHPELWEFESISMFINSNPFENIDTTNFNLSDSVGNLVCCGVIGDIQKKKDRGGKKFVFFDMYTKHGKIEATCYAKDYVSMQLFIEKGRAVVTKGKYNSETKSYVILGIKDYFEWKLENNME